MSRRNGFVVEIIGNNSDEHDLIVDGEGFEEAWQVSAKVFDANGDEITPTAGILRLSLRPVGGSQYLEADEDIDLTLGDFYRPFNIKAEAALFEVFGLDPDTAKVRISANAVGIVV